MERNNLQTNWCLECEERWEKKIWDVSRGKRITRQCRACRKDDSLLIKDWSPDIQGWACSLCVREEERIASLRKKLEMLKAKVAARERERC